MDAGSTDADFKAYLLNSAVSLPLVASCNTAAHKKVGKELAFILLWIRWQLGNPDALTVLSPVMQQSAKDIYPMRADQRRSGQLRVLFSRSSVRSWRITVTLRPRDSS